MIIKCCLCCGGNFTIRPQTPGQEYCSDASCQRERRRLWQKTKRQIDPDYRENQARAQQKWNDRHSGYWAEYRKLHPEYVEANRSRQRLRNLKLVASDIAKINVMGSAFKLKSGFYLLIDASNPKIAMEDACVVEIILVTGSAT
jgi:hypothetical protein